MKASQSAGLSACALVGAMLLVSPARVYVQGTAGQAARPQAQNARQAPAEAEAKKEAPQPPEVAALNEAVKITDTQKKIAALEKVIADFPDTAAADIAQRQLVSQLTTNLRNDKALLEYVDEQMEKAKDASSYDRMAASLLRMDMMLDQAASLAKKGLEVDEGAFIERTNEARKAAQSRPRLQSSRKDGVTEWHLAETPGGTLRPDAGAGPEGQGEDEIRQQFRSMHANLLSTLGQIYAKQGKDAEAEKALKEAYEADTPAASKRSIALALGDLASKTGDDRSALEYRATAYVLGNASPETRSALEDVYRKTHNGSADGLDAMLDARYRTLMKPLEVEPYTRPKASNPRVVLAELFTGAGCPPCVAADLAFDAVLERYSRQDVAVLVYHQHIPRPDPMTNPSTEARKSIYSLRGVPTFAVDGKSTVGGGGAEQARAIFDEELKPAIEKELGVVPAAALQLSAKMSGSTIRVKAKVGAVKSKSDKLKLQIALVEQEQRYSGPNGMRFHPMVVRNLAGNDGGGFAVPAARGSTVDYTFDLAKILADNKKAIDEFLAKPFRGGDKPTFTEGRRDEIDPNNLMVVAFVQDEDPKQPGQGDAQQGDFMRRVLQAAVVKVQAPKGTTRE
jgi:tetratricopeptide (TPR) repeat protein